MKKLSEIYSKFKHFFIKGRAFESVVCKMALFCLGLNVVYNTKYKSVEVD